MEYEIGYYWVRYQGELTIAAFYGDEIGWDMLELIEDETSNNMDCIEILEKIKPPH